MADLSAQDQTDFALAIRQQFDPNASAAEVTAKDIPLDTITESAVEFSDASDPVLVLSVRAPDDEIKTMKLVFSQNGLDRSDEVDEWIALLNEKSRSKKHKKTSGQKRAGSRA
jgi:hypothetical protein